MAAMMTIGVARASSAGEVNTMSVTTLRTSLVIRNTTTRNRTMKGMRKVATRSASFSTGA